MQRGSTILIIVTAVVAITYLILRQWRYEQHLSGEAKRQWWRQQIPPIFFLTTLIGIGLATLARVNAILLMCGGVLAAGILCGLSALRFYRHNQREIVPREQAILAYGIYFLLFAFIVATVVAWLRMFGML